MSYNNNAQCEIGRAADMMMTYYEKHRSQCKYIYIIYMHSSMSHDYYIIVTKGGVCFTPKSLTTFCFFTSYYVGNCIIESDALKYNIFAIYIICYEITYDN